MISNLVNRPLSNGDPVPDIAFHDSKGNNYELRMIDGTLNTLGLRFGGAGGDDEPFSIMGWANCQGDKHTIFQVQNEYSFDILNASTVALTLTSYDGVYETKKREVDDANIVDNNRSKWTHWACTYDGSNNNSGQKIYIDGNRVDNNNDNNGTYAGMSDQDGKGYMVDYEGDSGNKGLLSDVSVYDVELLADDIKMIASHRNGFNHMLWNKGSNCKFWTDMNEQYRSGLESYTFLNQILKISDQVEDGAITVNASGSQSLAERWQRFKGPTTK
tara:strand:+ start:364 stop:1182 length:819 start_codon:yes stop_codon:yes gene_type:complete